MLKKFKRYLLGTTPQQTQPVDNINDNELTTNEEIPFTPFRLIGNRKMGYAITLGNYMLHTALPTKHDALQMLETNPWPIIMNLITIMPDIQQEAKKIQALQNQDGKAAHMPNYNNLQEAIKNSQP